MIFTGLMFGLNNELKNKIWLLEKQHRQIIVAKSGRTFNRTCLMNALLNFYDFYT